ncbi:MAG: glycosyltransferase family 2 protein, partial [Candidatus Omnitrophica bacterium]|nr:glycosyltransferase family 2 protein [Candidatus Omnitrophota bacterium]
MISIVIPSYNEAENLPETLKALAQVLESAIADSQYEIIVVDDHSTDQSLEVVTSLLDDRVRCIRLSRRSGSHIAVRAGLLEARGEVVLCTAADGQDDPLALTAMLEQWHKGYQVIWACRQNRQGEPLVYRLTTQLFYNFLAFVCKASSEERVLVSNADFFLLDRVVVDALNSCGETQTSLFGLILWGGFKQTSVEYVRKARRAGQSKWNFSKRVSLAKDWVLAFSGF